MLRPLARVISPQLPRATDRVAILGRTGSGKTTMAAWLLANHNIDRKPWVIIDYKGEEIFDQIEKRSKDIITPLKVTDDAPKRPGLYRVEPVPGEDDDEITKLFWRIWDRQNTGIYVDEGHLTPNSDALKSLFVTGRSRRIPMIFISQRPAWVPREVWSESNHHVVFDLNHYEDRKTVGAFATGDGKAIPRIREYCSLWNDVRRNVQFPMSPAPPADHSISIIMNKAPRRFRWL